METNNCPLVSVPVVTYNSSKTVLETLESIKAQTYQNIELIISDDCSTDDTVEICKKWVLENENRFVRTLVLESPVNTGISANGNRAKEACRGEWIKGIAGDDLLMPDCIESCINYVASNPSTIYLFGKIQSFGADQQRCAEVDSWFDYSFFSLTPEHQIHRLLFEDNCIPASTVFYNRLRATQIGVKNDSRIPLLEDWPKWVNLLRSGVTFHFIDQIIVKYRLGGISTNTRVSMPFFRSNRLMLFYYQYPEWIKEDLDKAVNRIVDEECSLYEENVWLIKENERLQSMLERIHKSLPYRLYSKFMFPIKDFYVNQKRKTNV